MDRRTIGAVVVLGLATAGALVACQLLVPLDEQQCSSDSDCSARGPAFAGATCANHVCVAPTGPVDSGPAVDAGPDTAIDPNDPWGCLQLPNEKPDPGRQVAVTLFAVDALQPITTAGPQGGDDLTLVSGSVLEGISVQACNFLDPTCQAPVTAAVLSDDAGAAHLAVPGNFAGYYKIEGGGLIPATVYPGQVMADAAAQTYLTPLVRTIGVFGLASQIQVKLDDPDAGEGFMFYQIYDCFDRHGQGVTVTFNADGGHTQAFYADDNGLPITTADRTSSLGAGGAVNVPSGVISVTATLAGTTRVLGTANAVIRPASASFVYVRVRSH